jgi:hypothetical protein
MAVPVGCPCLDTYLHNRHNQILTLLEFSDEHDAKTFSPFFELDHLVDLPDTEE